MSLSRAEDFRYKSGLTKNSTLTITSDRITLKAARTESLSELSRYAKQIAEQINDQQTVRGTLKRNGSITLRYSNKDVAYRFREGVIDDGEHAG